MVNKLNTHINFISRLVEKGGPDPNEYNLFDNWLCEVNKELQSVSLQLMI
ncbi:MAG: hypothetical protein ACFFAH_06470 [Promethearchaeota archaeon]